MMEREEKIVSESEREDELYTYTNCAGLCYVEVHVDGLLAIQEEREQSSLPYNSNIFNNQRT